jgi:hypothetical protein
MTYGIAPGKPLRRTQSDKNATYSMSNVRGLDFHLLSALAVSLLSVV